MMTHYYKILLIFAAVIATSCTNEGSVQQPESPAEKGTPIVFSSSIAEGEQTTRASEGLENAYTTFKVWGYKSTTVSDNTPYSYGGTQEVFPGYAVTWAENTAGTTSSNTSDWEYVGVSGTTQQTMKYWDDTALAYRFFAVAPTNGATPTVAEDKVTVSLQLDASSATTPLFSHLWFSTGNTTEGYVAFGQPVTMEFVRPLCKVRIMFVDATGNTYDNKQNIISASTIKFAPATGESIYTEGTATITYPITGTATAETFSASGTTALTENALTIPYEETKSLVADDANLKKWYTLIPQEYAKAFTLSVTMNSVETKAVVPAQFMNWRPGYEYTYVFKVLTESVEFSHVLEVYTKWQAGYSDNTTW